MRAPGTRRQRQLLGLLLAGVLAGTTLLPATASGEPAGRDQVPDLSLVTLTGPGTSGGDATRSQLLRRQDRVLARVGGVEPALRWTTALNGFAAPLTRAQERTLEAHPRVALVEDNEVRRTASHPRTTGIRAADPAAERHPARGGAGIVVGVVDSGLRPDLPVFADLPGLGRDPRGWHGDCRGGEGWPRSTCQRKIVGSRWFVAGFGADRIRSSEVLSPLDVSGHGTRVASLAAGNSGVSVGLPGGSGATNRTFRGVAPRARLAVYKACWTAPDPADDGCATADLVTAVDRATADGVDVLNLAVADDRSSGVLVDTVDRALLGAAEADTVVVTAAGNDPASYAAHGVPWVTTVGAAQGPEPQSTVRVAGGSSFTGAGRVDREVGPAPLVAAVRAAAPGATPLQARQCHADALDSGTVDGKVVLCQRGGTGRVDKSAAVERAGGIGMVLTNTRQHGLFADLHSVPTVHLTRTQGRVLRDRLLDHPRTRVRLSPAAAAPAHGVPSWTPAGDPRAAGVEPDLVAAGTGVLAASTDASGWSVFTGTSAAAAQASGAAAVLLGRTGWDATRVRSALLATAEPMPDAPATRTGAGRLGSGATPRLVLDQDPTDYRRAMRGALPESRLNLPTILLAGGRATATRTVTNTGDRAEYFSVRVDGLPGLRVTPVALRLAPGESADFTVQAPGGAGQARGGAVVWRGARGSVTRVPVLLAR